MVDVKSNHRGGFMLFSRGSKKRGQLTIFVIVAIVIVVGMVGYFLIVESSGDSVSPEVSSLYDAVVDCADDVSVDSIEIVGESGGYFDLPERSSSLSIAYYFYEDESLAPGLEVVEGEMAKYVEQMFFFCVEEVYLNFPDYEVDGGEIDVDVEIRRDDKVYFSVDYPFSVEKGNVSYSFDEPIKGVYDVRLFSIYNFILEMMEWQLEEPRALCVNCISDRAFELGLFVDMWDVGDNDVLFFVSDEKSVVNGELYKFFFVNKYVGGNYDPFADM